MQTHNICFELCGALSHKAYGAGFVPPLAEGFALEPGPRHRRSPRAADVVPAARGQHGSQAGSHCRTHKPCQRGTLSIGARSLRTFPLTQFRGSNTDNDPGAGADREADERVPAAMALALRGDPENILPRDRLFTSARADHQTLITHRTHLPGVGFGVVQHHADLLSGLELLDVVPGILCGLGHSQYGNQNDT